MLITFLFAFIVYLSTLSPTVGAGDSGELVTAAATLGIAHAPGYPLYSLAGKIFDFLIPWGNPAYRINIMSGFFAAGTVVLAGGIIKELVGEKYRVYLVVPLVLAFSPEFWSQAVVAEVFTLHTFLAGLIILLLVKDKSLFSAAFLLALGLTNQQTIVFLFPLLFVVLRQEKISLTKIRRLVIIFLIGFSLYFYLPLRSANNPIQNWGHPSTLTNFIKTVIRADYGTFRLVAKNANAHSWKNIFDQIVNYFQCLNKEFNLIGIALFLAGIFYWFRHKRKDLAAGLLAGFLLSGPGFVLWANLPLDGLHLSTLGRFFMLPNFIFIVFAGVGLAAFLERLPKTALLLPALPLIFLARGWALNNQRQNFIAYDYGKNILRSLPEGSRLFIRADNEVFILSYLAKVERRRKDLNIYDETGEVFFDIDQEKLNLLMQNPEKIFFTAESFFMKKNLFTPQRYGLLYQMGRYRIDNPFLFSIDRSLPGLRYFHNYRQRNIAAQYYTALADFYWLKEDSQKGRELYRQALAVGPDIIWIRTYLGNNYLREGKFDEAINEYKIAALGRTGEAEPHANLSIAYQKKGDLEQAVEEYEKTKNLNPGISAALNKSLTEKCFLKGNEYYYAQKFAEAEKMYRYCLRYDLSTADVYCNLAAACFQQKFIDQALEYYRKAIAINPLCWDAYLNLGNINANSGRFKEAEKNWRRVLQINPGAKQARENLTKILGKK